MMAEGCVGVGGSGDNFTTETGKSLSATEMITPSAITNAATMTPSTTTRQLRSSTRSKRKTRNSIAAAAAIRDSVGDDSDVEMEDIGIGRKMTNTSPLAATSVDGTGSATSATTNDASLSSFTVWKRVDVRDEMCIIMHVLLKAHQLCLSENLAVPALSCLLDVGHHHENMIENKNNNAIQHNENGEEDTKKERKVKKGKKTTKSKVVNEPTNEMEVEKDDRRPTQSADDLHAVPRHTFLSIFGQSNFSINPSPHVSPSI